jgi:uncharacterized membrane protein YhaH (DUF805 family)
MGFSDAVRSCLTKYAIFSGRACRSEYWWFALFGIIVDVAGNIIDSAIGTGFVGFVAGIALLLPNIAVGIRRLHDIDRTGWWALIAFVPVIGWILLIVWACTPGTPGPNRFGPNPLPAMAGVVV